MERRDWVVLLLAFKGGGTDGDPSLDPIRIQKGMFRLAQEGGVPEGERYDFVAHHYGPYSRGLKDDVERLAQEGYVTKKPVEGYAWSTYRLSHAGMERARQLLDDEATGDQARTVFDIKQSITSVSFNELLRDIYSTYPQYAVASVFRT